ncbi:hypothetical protein E3P96_02464, partial [Wallemia ichthyophaga]
MSRNKQVLEAFESFRQKHSKQNREIIVNNTLLNIRNQQLQQDLARLWDENTQLRLQLSQSNHQLNTRHNKVIDKVVDQLNSLKGDYKQPSSAPKTSSYPIQRRVLAAPPELDSIQENLGSSSSSSSSDNEITSQDAKEAVHSRLISRRRLSRNSLSQPRQSPRIPNSRKKDDSDFELDDNKPEPATKARRNKRRHSEDGTSPSPQPYGGKKRPKPRKSNTNKSPDKPEASTSEAVKEPKEVEPPVALPVDPPAELLAQPPAQPARPKRGRPKKNTITSNVQPATETLRIRIQRTPEEGLEDPQEAQKVQKAQETQKAQKAQEAQ